MFRSEISLSALYVINGLRLMFRSVISLSVIAVINFCNFSIVSIDCLRLLFPLL